IVGFVTAGTVLSFGSGPVALLAIRKQLPEAKRPFKLPAATLLCYLAFFAANLIVYWSGWADMWKLMIAIFLGYIVLIINEISNHKITPKLEIRSGLWIFAWLAGLTVISYLGTYPKLSEGAGNIGVLSVGWSVVVIAVFTAFITWLAVHSR